MKRIGYIDGRRLFLADGQALSFGTDKDIAVSFNASLDALEFGGHIYLPTGKNILLASGGVINFGNGDVTLTHSANLLTILGGGLTIGVNETGHDVKFFGATSGSYMMWDQSHGLLKVEAGSIRVGDDGYLYLGSENDISIKWDNANTKLVIKSVTENNVIYWGEDGKGIDQTWYGATPGSYMFWNQSHDTLHLYASQLQIRDDCRLYFGSENDISIMWDDTNTKLVISSVTENNVIYWGEDGKGIDQTWYGATPGSYMFWDQSHNRLKFINAGLTVDGVNGADFSGAITSLTIVKGIVTAAA